MTPKNNINSSIDSTDSDSVDNKDVEVSLLKGQIIKFADELNFLYHKEKDESKELNSKLKDLAIAQKQSLLYAEDLSNTYQKERHRSLELKKALSEIESTYDSTLIALVNALDAREKETQAHSQRVMEYNLELASHADITGTELIDLGRGSLLHDIGKIGITDDILLKPGKLDEDDWCEMRKHPQVGYKILKDIKFLNEPSKIVFTHQERFDGKGYPQGLIGNQIPVGARLFAVVDTLDAMTSDRPYRKALTYDDARKEIDSCRTTQFDPWAVDIFLSVPEERWAEIKTDVHNKIK